MTETQYLTQVLQAMDEEITGLQHFIDMQQKKILAFKEDLYENAPSDMDEPEVISTMEDIDHQVDLINVLIRRCDQMVHQKPSPYFGKLIFRFDEDEETMPLYIGSQGFRSSARGEQMIYDWRAPVCSMFYDHTLGRASYQAPMGEITGDILQRRQIRIEQEELVYALDTDEAIGDEILARALSHNSHSRMKSVAATIQREQNRAIRNTEARTLIVDGRAGSGKTVIAMHRAAWLLYNNRDTMNASDILVLSPNRVFSDYISGILPEMGEDEVPEKEWDDLMNEMLFLAEPVETHLEQADRILQGGETRQQRIANIRRKSSIAFFDGFLDYLKRLEESMTFSDFRFEKTVLPGERIHTLFHQVFAGAPLYQRFTHIAEAVIDAMEEQSGKVYEGRRRDNLASQIQKEMIIRFGQRNIVDIYRGYLREQSAGDPSRENCFNEAGAICYEDALPIFFLQIYLYGCRTYRNIRHLIVDEMQDYTIFQYAILDRLFPCRKTILGDRYQVLFYDEKETILDVLRRIFPEQEVLTLDIAYRSTRQITDFCRSILGEEGISSFAREGSEPQVFRPADRGELLRRTMALLLQARAAGYENVAVLTDDETAAEDMYYEVREELDRIARDAGLDYDLPLQLLTENSAGYYGGFVFLPKYFAKGMEFDEVLVVNETPREDPEAGRREYYISCTRALHELYVLQMF